MVLGMSVWVCVGVCGGGGRRRGGGAAVGGRLLGGTWQRLQSSCRGCRRLSACCWPPLSLKVSRHPSCSAPGCTDHAGVVLQGNGHVCQVDNGASSGKVHGLQGGGMGFGGGVVLVVSGACKTTAGTAPGESGGSASFRMA